MCRNMVDIQSAAAEIRRGKNKKKKIEDTRTTGQKYNGLHAYLHRAAIMKESKNFIPDRPEMQNLRQPLDAVASPLVFASDHSSPNELHTHYHYSLTFAAGFQRGRRFSVKRLRVSYSLQE